MSISFSFHLVKETFKDEQSILWTWVRGTRTGEKCCHFVHRREDVQQQEFEVWWARWWNTKSDEKQANKERRVIERARRCQSVWTLAMREGRGGSGERKGSLQTGICSGGGEKERGQWHSVTELCTLTGTRTHCVSSVSLSKCVSQAVSPSFLCLSAGMLRRARDIPPLTVRAVYSLPTRFSSFWSAFICFVFLSWVVFTGTLVLSLTEASMLKPCHPLLSGTTHSEPRRWN